MGNVPPPVNTVAPVVTSSGQVFSTTNGTWAGVPTSYTYQWKRGGVDIGGATNANYTVVAADVAATLTCVVTATNGSGSASATSNGLALTITQKNICLAPIGYWPLAESSGTTIVDESGNGRNGVYGATTKAPTLGATGIGDGRTAASFDGGDYGDVLSAGLTAAFTGGELTVSAWLQMSGAGVWTDGTERRAVELLKTDGNNEIWMGRSTTNNTLFFQVVAGGTTKNTSQNGLSSTGWMHLALMFSKTADQMKAYINGAQIGTTQTGLGTWSTGLTRAIIGGANTTPLFPTSGNLAHVAIFPVLTDAQIAALAVV